MLKLTNVKKIYTTKAGDVAALDGINLVFPDNGLVFVTGASGSGKTTLLNVIGGLDGINEGEININGRSFSSLDAKESDSYRNTFVGFVFQEYNLLPDYTVRQNIEMANELQGKKTTDEEFENLLDLMGISGHGQRLPSELSGGQKQRVAIARALLKNPQILMADEPTGALDSVNGIQIMEILKNLSKTKLVIIVSHDLELAEKYADRIIRLKDGLVVEDFEINDVEIDGNCHVSENSISILEGASLNDDEAKKLVKAIKEKKKIEITKVVTIKEKKKTEVNLDKEYNGEEVKLIDSKMKIKRAISMGLKSLKVKPLRLFFTILLSVVAFAVFGIFDTVASYNRAVLISNTLRDNGWQTSTLVTTLNYYGDSIVDSYAIGVGQEDVEQIKQKTNFGFKGLFDLSGKNEETLVTEFGSMKLKRGDSYYLKNLIGAMEVSNSEIENGVIKGFNYNVLYKEEDFDFTLKYDADGVLDEDSLHRVGVSTYFLDVITKYFSKDNGNHYGFTFGGKKINSVEDYLGTSFVTYQDGGNHRWTISAIIDCGPIVNDQELLKKFEELKGANDTDEDKEVASKFQTYINNGGHRTMFVSENFANEYVNLYNRGTLYKSNGCSFRVSGENLETKKVNDFFYNIKDQQGKNNVLFFDDSRNDEPISLADREVIVSFGNLITGVDYGTFDKLFYLDNLLPSQNEKTRAIELIATLEKENVLVPEEYWGYPEDEQVYMVKRDALKEFIALIGHDESKFKQLTIEKVLQDDEVVSGCKLKVVGVYFDINCPIASKSWRPFMVNDNVLKEFEICQNQGNYYKLISPINKASAMSVANLMSVENGIGLVWYKNYDLEMLTENHTTVQKFFNLFLYVALVLALFSMFMLFNYMSTSISAKKQSVGILRALGSSGKNVFIMFIVESLIISIINAFFACIVTSIACVIVNQYIINVMGIGLTFATFGIRQILVLFGISIGTAIVSSVLPIIKISKQKPVELIRKV